MVLNTRIRSFSVLVMIHTLFLQSCSTIDFHEQKTETLIPAQLPGSLHSAKGAQSEGTEEGHDQGRFNTDQESVKAKVEQSGSQVQAKDSDEESESKRSTKSSPTSRSDLVATLLLKANKAMKLQQWLRAQRSLEQALRIEPNNIDTYILYGQVYQGMGLEEKSVQMFKRALFLSGHDSDLEKRLFPNN